MHVRRMRDNKLKHRFKLAIKKNFFIQRTAKQWNMPREAVQSLFLEGFKTQLDKALSNWGLIPVDPALRRRLDYRLSEVPS